MLDGLEAVDWMSYAGAYGPANEAPGILRAIASPDRETADEGQDDLASSLWHQGTVYPATVVAVPFLVELATTPGVHRRERLLSVLGAWCDPGRTYGADQPAVRAAVTERAGTLVSQLDDPDPRVRECAAYVVAHCGAPTRAALQDRRAVEGDPRVRASLLLGLALDDPAGSAHLLRSAAMSEPFPVPAAAALAMARAGLRIPAQAIAPVAAAFGTVDQWHAPWLSGAEPLGEVLDRVDSATAGALTAAMTGAGVTPRRGTARSATGRIRVAEAMVERFQSRRSAPVELMPQLRELLADAVEGVRAAAVQAVAQAGVPAAAVADDLARIAAGEDDGAHRGPMRTALRTLVRLGDPRWREPTLTAWAAGRDPASADLFADHPPPFDAEVCAGARRRLAGQLAAGITGNPVIALVTLLGAYGPAAADAVPDIIVALPAAPWAAPAALASIGPAALPAVPALREAAETGDVRAGHAVWRLTGDAGPLVTAASVLLATGRRGLAWDLTLLADAGPAAAPIAAVLGDRLTGSPAPTHPQREEQIAAGRVVWRATGDPDPVLSTVDAVLWAGEVPVRAAAALAADMAPAGAALVPALRQSLHDRWGSVDAARALWRHGTVVDELVAPLLDACADPYGDNGAIRLLVRMGATAAAPRLTELARRDERVVTHGSHDDTVWLDDRLRQHLHDALVALGSPS